VDRVAKKSGSPPKTNHPSFLGHAQPLQQLVIRTDRKHLHYQRTSREPRLASTRYEGRSKSFASRYVILKNFSIFVHQ